MRDPPAQARLLAASLRGQYGYPRFHVLRAGRTCEPVALHALPEKPLCAADLLEQTGAAALSALVAGGSDAWALGIVSVGDGTKALEALRAWVPESPNTRTIRC